MFLMPALPAQPVRIVTSLRVRRAKLSFWGQPSPSDLPGCLEGFYDELRLGRGRLSIITANVAID